MVGDKQYPAATGRTKKEAKEEAAKLVYDEICGSKTTEVSNNMHLHSQNLELGCQLSCIDCETHTVFHTLRNTERRTEHRDSS